jgi:tetratricopeptide (TPR) repeat protein
LGSSYASLKEYKKAIERYNLAIHKLPSYARFYTSRAISFFNENNQHSALNDFNKAIELDGEKSYYYEARGIYYSLIMKYAEANLDFNKAIQLDPNNYYAHKGRGIINATWNRRDEALADFNIALQIAQKEGNIGEVNDIKSQINNIERIKKIYYKITILGLITFCVLGFVTFIFAKLISKRYLPTKNLKKL